MRRVKLTDEQYKEYSDVFRRNERATKILADRVMAFVSVTYVLLLDISNTNFAGDLFGNLATTDLATDTDREVRRTRRRRRRYAM